MDQGIIPYLLQVTPALQHIHHDLPGSGFHISKEAVERASITAPDGVLQVDLHTELLIPKKSGEYDPSAVRVLLCMLSEKFIELNNPEAMEQINGVLVFIEKARAKEEYDMGHLSEEIARILERVDPDLPKTSIAVLQKLLALCSSGNVLLGYSDLESIKMGNEEGVDAWIIRYLENNPGQPREAEALILKMARDCLDHVLPDLPGAPPTDPKAGLLGPQVSTALLSGNENPSAAGVGIQR